MKKNKRFFETEFQRIIVYIAFQEVLIIGRICYGRLNKNMCLKMEFVTQEIAGKYSALKASLLHFRRGMVDCIILEFVDIMGIKQIDNSGFKNGFQPYIWEYENIIEWFFYQPSEEDYQSLANAINSYMHMFMEKGVHT